MTYQQLEAANVFVTISKGFNVVVCDFGKNAILYTNELTVETIRNYITQKDVAFFKISEATK